MLPIRKAAVVGCAGESSCKEAVDPAEKFAVDEVSPGQLVK